MDAIANLAVNTIRTLSLDAVQRADAGQPGLPIGAAPMAYGRYPGHRRHERSDRRWPDHDPFGLSPGRWTGDPGRRLAVGSGLVWFTDNRAVFRWMITGDSQLRWAGTDNGVMRIATALASSTDEALVRATAPSGCSRQHAAEAHWPPAGRTDPPLTPGPSDKRGPYSRSGRRPHPLRRRRVFIGSSTEALHVAKAVQMNLDARLETTLWTQGVFRAGEYRIESLSRGLQKQDFAVFLATADDVTLRRGQTIATVRDNIHVEIGIAVGALGPQRVFVLCDRTRIASLPSDLEGINTIAFSPPSAGNWAAALGAACSAIEDAIGVVGDGPGRRQDPTLGRGR